MTAAQPISTLATSELGAQDEGAPPQHPLWLSVLLHLLPGAALTAFVVAAAPVVTGWGFPPVFALFAGIGLVIVPLELGWLALHARRTTGRWSPLAAVDYRVRLPWRRVARLSAVLLVAFMVPLVVSMLLLDEWLAANLFAWMPEAILQFSSTEEAGPMAGWATAVMVVVAFAGNGILGPITEELYFRGHLLPRLSRYGRGAPVLNTVLFSLYHLWTPWQNPARILGFLPLTWTAWRLRSVQVAAAAHMTINVVFLLLLVAATAGAAG
jgi:uncharacterized protein